MSSSGGKILEGQMSSYGPFWSELRNAIKSVCLKIRLNNANQRTSRSQIMWLRTGNTIPGRGPSLQRERHRRRAVGGYREARGASASRELDGWIFRRRSQRCIRLEGQRDLAGDLLRIRRAWRQRAVQLLRRGSRAR